jgi:hypothetical protein
MAGAGQDESCANRQQQRDRMRQHDAGKHVDHRLSDRNQQPGDRQIADRVARTRRHIARHAVQTGDEGNAGIDPQGSEEESELVSHRAGLRPRNGAPW